MYSSLVIVKEFNDMKFLRLIEYLTLRRVHSLEAKEVAQIISSYAYLAMGKGESSIVNTSFIKTFEYVIVNKMHDYSSD